MLVVLLVLACAGMAAGATLGFVHDDGGAGDDCGVERDGECPRMQMWISGSCGSVVWDQLAITKFLSTHGIL